MYKRQVYAVAHALHVPPFPAAALAVCATLVLTGGLHEAGLADVAEGFGGGGTRERKLEIMPSLVGSEMCIRDSARPALDQLQQPVHGGRRKACPCNVLASF